MESQALFVDINLIALHSCSLVLFIIVHQDKRNTASAIWEDQIDHDERAHYHYWN